MIISTLNKSLHVFPSCCWGHPNTNIRFNPGKGRWFCNHLGRNQNRSTQQAYSTSPKHKIKHGPEWERGWLTTPFLEGTSQHGGRQHIFRLLFQAPIWTKSRFPNVRLSVTVDIVWQNQTLRGPSPTSNRTSPSFPPLSPWNHQSHVLMCTVPTQKKLQWVSFPRTVLGKQSPFTLYSTSLLYHNPCNTSPRVSHWEHKNNYFSVGRDIESRLWSLMIN